jgi:hypothetical protein
MTTEAALAKLRLGTSGWSYNDWVGPFYASGTRPADFESAAPALASHAPKVVTELSVADMYASMHAPAANRPEGPAWAPAAGPELERVFKTWPRLLPPIRAAIVALLAIAE